MTTSTAAFPTSVDGVTARAALGAAVPRLTALIRSIHDPGAPALGTWTIAEVAVHLAQVWEALPALARRDLQSPLRAPDDLAELTIAMVREEPERDLEAIATRIDSAASAYLRSPTVDDGPRPWLVDGTALPATAFTCHILNETLVHGHDIARAQRRPWRIEPAHAGMAIMGFLFPALSVVAPRFPVDQRRAAGVRACFDIRVRGAGRAYLVLDDGALSIEPPSGRPVDCHISAEPAALFLMIWSRTALWRGALAGGISMWGRRPWLGVRLAGMLRNP
jgi:hypothetical protein